eukprot:GSMAST32.ASY1.ANO1.2232.1 assembled CDS
MIKLNICIAIAILACFCIMCMGEKVLGRPKHHHKKHTLKKHTHKHHHAQARFKKADDKEADDKEADAEEANDDKEKKEKKGGGKKVKEGEAVEEPVAEAAGGKAAGPTGETGAVSLTDILQNSALPVKHSGINVPGSGGGLVEQLQSENGDSGKREPGQFIPFGKNIPKKAGIIYYTSTGVQECEICKLINKNAYLLACMFYFFSISNLFFVRNFVPNEFFLKYFFKIHVLNL